MSSTKSATSQIELRADTPQSHIDQQGKPRDAGPTVTDEIRAKQLSMCCKKENVLLLLRVKDLTYTIQIQKELIAQLSCHGNNNNKITLPANNDNHSEPPSQLTDSTTTQTRLKWNKSFATAKSPKNTKKNKTLILADSHGRNLSTLLGAEEDTSTVSSIIKPNGLMESVLEESKELCTDLTKNDHLIIHAGTNNIPHDPFKIISTLLLALPPLSHTNIVIITIPMRLSSTSTYINKLTSIINKHLRILPHFFPYVRIVEAEDLGKNPSTSSGIHLTKRGKATLCERIKTNIRTFAAKNQATTTIATNNTPSSPPFPNRRLPTIEQAPSSSDELTQTRTTVENSRDTIQNPPTPLPTMTATKIQDNATRSTQSPAGTAASVKNRGLPSSPAQPSTMKTVIMTKTPTPTQTPQTPKITATTPLPATTRQTPNATKITPLPAPTPKTTHTTRTTPRQTPKSTATRFPPTRASKSKNHKPIPPNRPFPPTKSSRIKQ